MHQVLVFATPVYLMFLVADGNTLRDNQKCLDLYVRALRSVSKVVFRLGHLVEVTPRI